MSGFAGYEGVKEFHRSGAKSIWTARREGEKSASFVIKSIDPGRTNWTPAEIKQQVQLFLERAGVQRAAAQQGKHWAPVHAMGEHQGGAALVTNYYRRTLQGILQQRITIDRKSVASLHH